MMRAIQPLEIQQWLNSYAGKSKTIITMVSSIMKAVYKSAYGEGIVSRDPTLGLIIPKPSEANKKRAFTSEECVRIENTIRSHKDGLFMGILYYLGLRCGDARGLPGMFLFSSGENRPMPRTTYQRMWMSLMIDAGFAKPIEHDIVEANEKRD